MLKIVGIKRLTKVEGKFLNNILKFIVKTSYESRLRTPLGTSLLSTGNQETEMLSSGGLKMQRTADSASTPLKQIENKTETNSKKCKTTSI